VKGREHLGNLSKRSAKFKMDLQEIEHASVDWIYLDQDRVRRWASVNTVMNFQFHGH